MFFTHLRRARAQVTLFRLVPTALNILEASNKTLRMRGHRTGVYIYVR